MAELSDEQQKQVMIDAEEKQMQEGRRARCLEYALRSLQTSRDAKEIVDMATVFETYLKG